MKKLWICGQYRSGETGNVVWDLQGIFSTEANAICACKNSNYFTAEFNLDEELPEETIIMNVKYAEFKEEC